MEDFCLPGDLLVLAETRAPMEILRLTTSQYADPGWSGLQAVRGDSLLTHLLKRGCCLLF